MSSPASLDVVIVNYRGCADALGAAEALTPWTFGTLWLVDNSEAPDEAAALRAYADTRPWVRVLVPAGNLGFGGGCNLAFAQSSASFMLLLNPDARIAPSDIAHLAATMTAGERLAAVSPNMYWDAARRFVVPPAPPQTPAIEMAIALATRAPAAARRLAMRHLARLRQEMSGSKPVDVDFLTGAVLLLRRAAVVAAGGLFDPRFFMFYEDSDLSLRLRRHGFRLAIDPAAAAVHTYRHKPSKLPLMLASRSEFFRKHHPRFYRLSGGLARLSLLRAAPPGNDEAATLHNAAEFNRHAGAGVIAWSPSAIMLPALFRPAGSAGVAFSDEDWESLEPGRYTAAVECARGGLRFVSFERAADVR